MQTINYNYSLMPDSEAFHYIWANLDEGNIYLQFKDGCLVGRVLPDEARSAEYLDSIESWGHYWHDTLRDRERVEVERGGVEFEYAPAVQDTDDISDNGFEVADSDGQIVARFNTSLIGSGAISGQDFNVEDDDLDSDYDFEDEDESEDSFVDSPIDESASWGEDEDGSGDTISLTFHGISPDDFLKFASSLDGVRALLAEAGLKFETAVISSFMEGKN